MNKNDMGYFGINDFFAVVGIGVCGSDGFQSPEVGRVYGADIQS